MLALVIDSATKILYEALVLDDVILEEHYIEGQNDHAKNIVDILNKMLKNQNKTVDDLDRIVCGIGPGSYTGVRMAVTVSKMLGAFKNIDVYEISTLSLIASGSTKNVLSMIDARRGNAFCALYNEGSLLIDEALRNKEEFLKNTNYDNVVTESLFKVDPIKCIKYAKLHKEVHSLEPNYLQKTEAERNLNHEA